MKTQRRGPGRAAAAVLSTALVVWAVPAVQAAPIVLSGPLGSGEEGIGSFTGTFDYSYNGTNGIVTVVLNNTTPEDSYITAFAFNLPGLPGVSVGGASLDPLSSTDPDFGIIGGPSFANGVNGQPFGYFDIGASLSGSWEGGGAPQPGIGFGGSATFVFLLSGTGLDTLVASDFLDTLSESPGKGEDFKAEDFVVRFRGFEGGGSDKVPHGSLVPEPGSLMLMGLGLVGLLASRYSRRRA